MTMGDRVAIINDGKLVQIDKPSNLYNKPINTFVASFIGSPKINFFDINHIIKFNNDKNNKLNDYLKNYNKTDLLLGVRPEDLTTEDKKDSLMIEVNPILIEDLGFSKDIIFSLSEIENENNFIARLSSESQIGSNNKIKLFFPINKLVVFNKNTNERINLDA